ncbi:MAG: hypothetical protein LBR06_06920 [Bacteroidales bacterium]|nr:hypothetical protein [Bacteroidales bacterium]
MAFLFLILSFTFYSCDRELQIDFLIENQSNDTIIVSGSSSKHNYNSPNVNEFSKIVYPNEQTTFFIAKTIQAFGFSNETGIPHYLDSIMIKSNKKTLTFNPLDSLFKWRLEEKSDEYYQTILTVHPNDLE